MDREVVVVLPDIRSTYNTGSFFRTGDAFGVSKIFLTGITATPPHPHLIKVSLGAEQSVIWEYVMDVQKVCVDLRAQGFQLIGVEQTDNSVDLARMTWKNKVALFFGNEVKGMSLDIVKHMDCCVEIPMQGAKESLNVSVAGGIVLYAATHHNQSRDIL